MVPADEGWVVAAEDGSEVDGLDDDVAPVESVVGAVLDPGVCVGSLAVLDASDVAEPVFVAELLTAVIGSDVSITPVPGAAVVNLTPPPGRARHNVGDR